MFESLGEKLNNAFKKFRNKGKLTEADVKAGMREIKLALLEADVNFKVVRDFIKIVSERAVGTEVLESLLPAQQIVDALEEMRERISLFACLDTLEYLYKGGRISHTTYKLGTLAQVKPIIRVTEEGAIEVPAKAMGMRKGMDTLCKRAAAHPADPDFPFYVMYTNNRSVAETLVSRLETVGITVPEK